MRRVLTLIPVIALIVAGATLTYASIAIRDSAAVQHDRVERAAFARSVQLGQRPDIAARNMGGALRQELAAQETAAAARMRASRWLQMAALLTVVGIASALAASRREGKGTLSASAA